MRLKGGITKTAGLIILIYAPFLLARPERTLQKNKVPQHDAAAIIKLVTVRVLDREGRPVTGLKKEDFVLYDNGVKKAITEFEIHTLGAEGMEVLPSGDAAGPPEPMEGMNRKLFIFLDIQGSGVSGMANAKEAALHFVDAQLHPSDEVGILAFSPTRGFLIQEYLTTDHERIRNAISKTKDIESMPSPGFVSTAGGDDSVRDRSSRSGGSASREDGDSIETGAPWRFYPADVRSDSGLEIHPRKQEPDHFHGPYSRTIRREAWEGIRQRQHARVYGQYRELGQTRRHDPICQEKARI
jgi:hypothetical protein